MRRIILAAVSAAALVPAAQAQEDRLAGRWISDVTGETINIGRKANGGMEVTFAKTGAATLTPEDQGQGLKLTYKSGMFTSTDCHYNVVRLGKGERMVLSPKDGTADGCPRGAFSRFDEKDIVATKPEKGRPAEVAVVPQARPPEPVRATRGVRSAESMAGRWSTRGGETIKVERAIGGWSLWSQTQGQGALVVSGDPDGAVQVNFGASGVNCPLAARMSDGELVLEPLDGRVSPSCPTGSFARVAQ